jgi:pilus assembly protein CpaE
MKSEPVTNELRVLVSADDGPWGDVVRACLVHLGLACEPRNVVSYGEIADRGLLERPDLIVLVQPDELSDSLALLRELTLVCSTPVITIGPADEPRRILSVMQAGAVEYVDRDSWTSGLEAAVLRYRSRATQASHTVSGKLLGVVSASGGTGTSSVAANVAIALMQRHQQVLLIDLDFEKGDLAALLDLRPQYTLGDLCDNAARLDRALFEQIVATHPSGLRLLAAPYQLPTGIAQNLRGVRRGLAFARDLFVYSVVDLGCAETAVQREALLQMDTVSLVVRLDYPSVRNARRLLDRLPEWGLPLDRVRLVANRYGQWRQLSVGQAEAALGRRIESLLPDDPSAMNRAINHGRPVVLEAPRARIARKLSELSVRLNGRIGSGPHPG